MTTADAATLVERYIDVWNEQDASSREEAVRELWAPDARLVNDRHEYRGQDGVLLAVTRAFERFTGKGYRFRPRGSVREHHGGIYAPWEMLDPQGVVVSSGPNFLMLDPNGRIELDFQFVER